MTTPTETSIDHANRDSNGFGRFHVSCGGCRRPDLTAHRPEAFWDAYVRMRGVHSFYESLRDQAFMMMPLKKQPYGDWEFEIRDPNGCIGVFSE